MAPVIRFTETPIKPGTPTLRPALMLPGTAPSAAPPSFTPRLPTRLGRRHGLIDTAAPTSKGPSPILLLLAPPSSTPSKI